MLISAAPRAVFMKAADGSLPLHLACLYSGPVDLPVIRYLLLLHPNSVEIPDGHGLLPKDIVCDNVVDFRVKIQIVECLIDAEQNQQGVVVVGGEQQNYSIAAGVNCISRNHVKTQNVLVDKQDKDETTLVVETKRCVVCMDREVSRLLVPCGHPGNFPFLFFPILLCNAEMHHPLEVSSLMLSVMMIAPQIPFPALCSTCSTSMYMLKMNWCCPECRSEVKDIVPFFGRVLMEG
jgi:hypothetical protein